METPISQEQVNILLVDDRPQNILALETELAPLGYTLVSVNSGEDALREVLEKDFAVIIMDIIMPGLDGYETANLIKARAKSQYIPIIFVTASGDEPLKSYRVGAVDYMSIPVNPEILRAKVSAFVELYKVRHELATSKLELEKARYELEFRVLERTKSLTKEIEERVKMEKALVASESKFRAIFESSNDAVMVFAEDRFTECNNKTLEIFGFSSKEEFTKLHPADISPPFQPNGMDSRSMANEKVETALLQGMNQFEWIHRRRNGEDFPADVLLSAFEFEGKMILQATARDITDRKRAEESLVQSEHKYRTLFTNMRNGFAYCKMIFDENNQPVDWIYLEVNDAFERVIGLKKEDVIGKRVTEVFPTIKEFKPNLFEIYGRVALTGEGIEFAIDFYLRNVWLAISTYSPQKGYFVAVFDDITERKKWEMELTETNQKLQQALDDINKTQKMLVRSEKLAAMGQLSAGVAHELKNPLNIIYTSTQLMMMEEELAGEVKDSCKIVMEQVMRAVKIIDNLRDFAREKKPEMKEMLLCPFIEKTMSLVAYEMKGEGIEITKECFPEQIRVMGDEDQLAQVFLNLINNARDSLNARKKSYTFEEAEKMGWRARLTIHTLVEDGKARIRFEDNGIGISEEDKKKLFTPFFTTKGETTGTGLGIAIALGIIENHGGTIEFESEYGKGAVFSVILPLAGE